MKILAIGASSSSTSINQHLADYAAAQINEAKVTSYPLSGIKMPVYSVDEEKENGIPSDAQSFLDTIRTHDALLISLAEHNGSYTAAFKNLIDWTSRIDPKLWSNKPTLLLSTSPGPRGAATVLEAAKGSFPHLGANIAASLSIPSFYDHFSNTGISDPTLAAQLDEAINELAKK